MARAASMCHARMRLPTPSWRHWQWTVPASSKFPSLSTSRCRRPHRAAPAATKELVKNKLPISCARGNGAIVPLGQVIVKEDFHVLFEISGVFAPGLVHLVQHPHRHAQASRGLRPFDALLRDVHRVEDDPLAGASDMREHL